MITKFTNFIIENLSIKIDLPQDIYDIKKEFDNAGKKLYVVGGAVRDFYKKIKPHDIDLVTDALPEESKRILKDKFFVSDEQGKSFGVLRIYTNAGPKEGYELATFRKDISKGRDTKGDEPKVEIGKHITIEDDVRRRDLTSNALFYDIDKEEIVDFVGGIEDIDKNIISAVGNASERFIEDRLRILRVFRFAARNHSKISQATIEAIRKDKRLRNISPVDDVSQERIVEEFNKAVEWSANNENIKSLNYYLELLEKYNMFEEMFPGVDININNINTYNLSIIFALLFRDNDVDKLRGKLRKYKFPNDIADTACFLLRLRDYLHDLDKVPLLYKEKIRYHVYNQTIEEFADLYNFNDNYLKAFLKYEPKINATEFMSGLKDAEIGKEKKRREIEEFKKLLNETKVFEKFSQKQLADFENCGIDIKSNDEYISIDLSKGNVNEHNIAIIDKVFNDYIIEFHSIDEASRIPHFGTFKGKLEKIAYYDNHEVGKYTNDTEEYRIRLCVKHDYGIRYHLLDINYPFIINLLETTANKYNL